MAYSDESLLLCGELCVAVKEDPAHAKNRADTILTFFHEDGSRKDNLVLIDAAIALAEQLTQAGYRVSKDEALDFIAARVAYHKKQASN